MSFPSFPSLSEYVLAGAFGVLGDFDEDPEFDLDGVEEEACPELLLADLLPEFEDLESELGLLPDLEEPESRETSALRSQ